MSLNRGEVNPLGLLKMRRLTSSPNHFSKIRVRTDTNINLLDQWISYNLNSRYAIKKTMVLDQNKKMIDALEIGVEDPKELTMLSLGCPHLKLI